MVAMSITIAKNVHVLITIISIVCFQKCQKLEMLCYRSLKTSIGEIETYYLIGMIKLG